MQVLTPLQNAKIHVYSAPYEANIQAIFQLLCEESGMDTQVLFRAVTAGRQVECLASIMHEKTDASSPSLHFGLMIASLEWWGLQVPAAFAAGNIINHAQIDSLLPTPPDTASDCLDSALEQSDALKHRGADLGPPAAVPLRLPEPPLLPIDLDPEAIEWINGVLDPETPAVPLQDDPSIAASPSQTQQRLCTGDPDF